MSSSSCSRRDASHFTNRPNEYLNTTVKAPTFSSLSHINTPPSHLHRSAMDANNILNLEPLPELFPWLQQNQHSSQTTFDDLLTIPSLLDLQNHTPLTAPIIHRPVSHPAIPSVPESSPTPASVRVPAQSDVTLSSLLHTNKFKTSLKSVLSRPQSRTLQRSARTPSRNLPDRNCDVSLTRRFPDRHANIPRTQSHNQIREHAPNHTRSSQHLTPKSKPSLRKVRSSSCSKLPRRKSQEIAPKRACDLADKAIAEGTPLSKEQARAIRNRQHAMASRLRAKQKRQSLESDNKQLNNRIKMLEEENSRLIRVRDALRLQQSLVFGSI